MKISILGRGSYTIPVASAICHLDLVSEVVLVEDRQGTPCDVLRDLQTSIAMAGCDTKLLSSQAVSALSDSEIIVLLPHSSPTGLRSISVQHSLNFSLVRNFAHSIKQYAPTARVVVAMQPVASLAFLVYRELRADPGQVIGLSGGIANAYLKTQIANQLGVSVQDVTTFVIGNDEAIYPLPQYCRVSGIPLEQLLDATQIDELTGAANDWHKRSVSADMTYSLSIWISQIVTAIALDKKRMMSVSSLIRARESEVYLTVPTKIGRNGAEEILQLDLTDAQREQFTQLVAKSVAEQRSF
jgi:malate dehydrogenase